MIEAILWDNDGVLVDTEHLFYEATRDEIATTGIHLDLEQYQNLTLRQGRSCFELLAERGIAPGEIRRIRRARNARYLERLGHGVELIDGVAETLASLYGRLPMAIVTSCNPDHFEVIHAPLGILRYFEFTLTNADYERHKPHPEPYLEAAARLSLQPADCLVIEDSERGLQSASRAGMECLVIPNALTRDGDFASASQVLESVRQVPDWVRGRASSR